MNVHEYTLAGLALSGFFTPPPAPSERRTTLWIDLDRETLSKAEGKISALFADGTQGDVAFKHAFDGYGDEISADPREQGAYEMG